MPFLTAIRQLLVIYRPCLTKSVVTDYWFASALLKNYQRRCPIFDI